MMLFLTLFKKTALPFGVPIILVILVLSMARGRFPVLRHIPIWIWVLIIVVLVLAWAAVLLIKWLMEKRRADAIEKGILSQAQRNVDQASPARRAEIEEIKRNLAEALMTLRHGPEGKKSLYTLPWYMIIGPPAIGKTTAIVNSGLNFPNMTTAKRMRGAGGTRNCDWWFSTDAILLDTAGRYAQSADRSETETEWFSFLDLLKRYRRKGPINGLILGYSVEAVLQEDEARLIDDARELRQRMDEILDRLGWTFPVYVLFTKSDLVAGFADFFSYLSPLERQQVWGASYPLVAGQDQKAAERFAEQFDLLVRRLREVRARRMAGMARSEAWGRVFMFPEEFAGLRGKLHLFLETLFEPNPFRRDVPLFRGAFFSSGKQVGKPFDLVVRRIQTLIGMTADQPEEQAEKEDAYFVRDLFAKVLKVDRDVVGHTQTTRGKALKLRLAALAAWAVVSVLTCVWIGGSCVRLQAKMSSTRRAGEAVQAAPGGSSLSESLELLDRLRNEITGSWRAFPLTPANTAREAAAAVYLKAARERILEPTEEQMADALERSRDLDGDRVRQLLRAELLLLRPQEQKTIGGSAQDLAAVLASFGSAAEQESSPVKARLEGLAGEFLTRAQPVREASSRERALQIGARRLADTHEAEEFFLGIVAAASRCEKDRDLASMAGSQSILRTDRVVRGAFTKAGWEKCVSSQLGDVEQIIDQDNRIIRLAGEQPNPHEPTRQDLLRLYQQAYPEEWGSFLESIRLRDYSGCKDAVDDLKKLKSPGTSPLLKLLQAASAEAELGEVKVKGLTLSRSEDLKPINVAMRPLRVFAEGSKDQISPLAEYSSRLNDIYDQVSACADDPTFEFDKAILRKAKGWAGEYADRFGASPLASSMQSLLEEPIKMTGTVVVTEGKGRVQESWQETVTSFFGQTLAGAYPFGTGEAASPEDVAAFFGPDGRLASFEKSLPAGAPPSPPLATCLAKAQEVRRVLGVTDNGLRAAFTIEAGAVRSTGTEIGDQNRKKIDRVTLKINGKALQDRLVGAKQSFTWSTDDDDTACSLALEHTAGNQKIADLEKEGSVWSWFQLVDQAKKSRDGDAWLLTWIFPDQGVEVDFRLTMKGGADPPFLKGSAFRDFGRYLSSMVN